MFGLRLATRDGRPVEGDAEARASAVAFRTQMLPHLDAAYTLARYLVRDSVLAEDVVQEAFLRAHRAFAQFHGTSPRAWLFAIVRNCCWTALQERRGVARVEVAGGQLSSAEIDGVAALPDPAPSVEDTLARAQEIEALRRTVMELPEPFREALVLREINELSYKEIAAVTGVAIGTVMSRLSRARTMLAELMLPNRETADCAKEGVR